MDEDSKAIAVGLGAGLGGFAALLIIGCVCWQILCGTCLERKSDAKFGKNFQMKTQRRNEKSREKVLAISTIKENSFFPSNDLAGKVKPKATQY